MTRSAMTTGILLGLLSLSPAKGQSPVEVQRLVEAILELDGTAERLRDLRAVYENEARLQKDRYQFSQEMFQMHLYWIDVVFGENEFTRDYLHGFTENFDGDLAQLALQWLRSPLAEKFRTMNLESRGPDYFEKLNAFLNSPEADRISEARRELLRRDAEESGCTEFRLDVLSVQELARLSVLNRFLPPKDQRSEEEMQTAVREMRERQREGISNGCWWPSLYVYRNARDAELEEYLAFFRTKAGKWLSDAHRGATVHAWLSAGKRLGEHGFQWPQDLELR